MKFYRRFNVLILAMAIPLAFLANVAPANANSTDGTAIQQAINLWKKGNLTQAVELQKEAVANQPSSWEAHAVLAYMLWRQGDAYDAISEEEAALKIDPSNAILQTNLGLMHQLTDNYDAAIAEYRRAVRLSSENWVSRLGIARCYFLDGKDSKGLVALRAMASKRDCDFEWYYRVGQTCLKVNQPLLAEKVASRAISAATTPQQRLAARGVLLLASLRSNNLAQAKSLQGEVFGSSSPKDHELYARTASQLLPATAPAEGKLLLQCACQNLQDETDSFAFFRLGRIFEGKAIDASSESSPDNEWLENARSAYLQAIALNPSVASFHSALADVLFRQHKTSDSLEELKKARPLDPGDALPSFLISHLSVNESDLKNALSLNLSKVRFGFGEGTCKCKLSKLATVMKTSKGVAFAQGTDKKPLGGVALIDQSLSPLKELFSKSSETAFAGIVKSGKPAPPITFELMAQESISSPAAALTFAREIRYGSPLSFEDSTTDFFNRFNEIQPIMPMTPISGDLPAETWQAAL